ELYPPHPILSIPTTENVSVKRLNDCTIMVFCSGTFINRSSKQQKWQPENGLKGVFRLPLAFAM
ncbi:hypothetical protein, partial [Kingella oralis]|uniref:hypothetical protein n=1 Tax=Kingella oralis TaxID=505 RepID=UPI003C6EC38A